MPSNLFDIYESPVSDDSYHFGFLEILISPITNLPAIILSETEDFVQGTNTTPKLLLRDFFWAYIY